MKILSLSLILLLCSHFKPGPHSAFITATVLANGEMPFLATDHNAQFHLVFGQGDSIMYSASDGKDAGFSKPVLVAKIPGLFSSSMRGPQIIATDRGTAIIACTQSGNIYSLWKDPLGHWGGPSKVNDLEGVSKEGLIALGADGKYLFAIWLDLRGNKKNKLVGARSDDGGKTWSKNMIIYNSPDGSICECCKPSIAVKGDQVFILFRNSLKGNRDLYLINSNNGGRNFGKAEKLGEGSWPLNGCPMDGGGLSLNDNNNPQTIWRRKNKLYACEPGKAEKEIGEGRNPSIAIVQGQNVYVWSGSGEIILTTAKGKKQILGKGSLPVIKSTSDGRIVCAWENNQHIEVASLNL
jgi:hypothetical protein